METVNKLVTGFGGRERVSVHPTHRGIGIKHNVSPKGEKSFPSNGMPTNTIISQNIHVPCPSFQEQGSAFA